MLYEMCKKAMISKNYKELDEAIKQKLPPYLYNGGQGEWIHCAQIACIRNSIRPPSKQFPFIRELPDPTTFKYGGSELLAKLIEGMILRSLSLKFKVPCFQSNTLLQKRLVYTLQDCKTSILWKTVRQCVILTLLFTQVTHRRLILISTLSTAGMWRTGAAWERLCSMSASSRAPPSISILPSVF